MFAPNKRQVITQTYDAFIHSRTYASPAINIWNDIPFKNAGSLISSRVLWLKFQDQELCHIWHDKSDRI